jgi:uncharacterized membrane protein YgdD (TMEM256/DUF423 family)
MKMSKRRRNKKTVRVVATIGAILIGLGIFSFIAANWQEMTREGKMLTVIFSMLCVDAIGWYLREMAHLEKSGEAMLFLGSLIFGGAIFLAAQMYNTRVYWPMDFCGGCWVRWSRHGHWKSRQFAGWRFLPGLWLWFGILSAFFRAKSIILCF